MGESSKTREGERSKWVLRNPSGLRDVMATLILVAFHSPMPRPIPSSQIDTQSNDGRRDERSKT